MRWPKETWSVQVVSSEGVDPQATGRAAIYLQHKLRHEYNLLTGWASHAGSERISSFWAAVGSLLPLPVALKASSAARQLSLPPPPMRPRDCDEEGGLGAGRTLLKKLLSEASSSFPLALRTSLLAATPLAALVRILRLLVSRLIRFLAGLSGLIALSILLTILVGIILFVITSP